MFYHWLIAIFIVKSEFKSLALAIDILTKYVVIGVLDVESEDCSHQ